MATNDALTHERLKAVLDYDPAAGIFTWLIDRTRGVRAGDKAGRVHPSGRVRIGIDGKIYAGHRLAWFWVHGVWPQSLDHANGIPSDNRLANLREATHAENQYNKGKTKRNKTGFNGVTYSPLTRHRKRPWLAHIGFERRVLGLGHYATPEEAHAAYSQAAKRLHGLFARVE